jgi:parallel beta-helix repeat protein
VRHSQVQQIVLVAAAFLWAVTGEAATVCVNSSGQGGCQKTIGAAVAAASSGDTVNIAAGTYKETVTIGKTLALIGSGPSQTIVDATGLGNAILVDGLNNTGLSGVVISGLTLQNANFEGILVTNASNVTITGNIVTGNNKGLQSSATGPVCPGIPSFETNEGDDCGEGIHLLGAQYSIVSNNSITGNSGGILISDDTAAAHDNLIAGNSVTNNPFDCGITLASHVPATVSGSANPLGVYNNKVVGNTSSQNGLMGEGAGIGVFASAPGTQAYGNIVVNNVATGNDIPGIAVHGHTPGQKLDNNVFIGNQISGNGADLADSATPGTAGINFFSVSPVSGTVIAQNTISGETIDVAWNAPGQANIQRNSFSGEFGISNLGPGTVNGEGNWWGCSGGPTGFTAVFAGCATISGQVTVNTWAATAPK